MALRSLEPISKSQTFIEYFFKFYALRNIRTTPKNAHHFFTLFKNIFTHSFVLKSQMMAVSSKEAVNKRDPSLLNLADITSAKWSAKRCVSCPVSAWKILAVLSMLQVTNWFGWIGLNSDATISAVWPQKVFIQFPLFVFQILAVLSKDPVKIRSHLG